MSIRSTCRRFSRNYKPLIIFFTMVQLVASSCSSTRNEHLSLTWQNLPEIPPSKGETVQPGLAGPISGAHGNYVLVAGGANFEDEMPWRGGRKKYHDVIFLMEKASSGEYFWKQADEKLPYPIAYSACVTTELGVVSIGGEDVDSPVADVFLLSFEDGNVKLTNLPALPQAISSANATNIGNEIFVIGGLIASGASSAFYSLNLKNIFDGWKVLPELPVALSHTVVVSQEDENQMCIYVIGGRNKESEISTFYSSIWKYTPSLKKWSMEGDIVSDQKPIGISAGTGIAAGVHQIVIFGGDPGIYFNRTERMNLALEKAAEKSEEELQKIRIEKDSMLTNHPGFSKEIIVYNTVTKQCEMIGEIAGESPVTTTAFSWNGTVIIPSGEIRPGVRTPRVIGVDLQVKRKQ